MEHVIFVHGTYAGSVGDTGTKWWQKGSVFANSLERKLPDDISCMSLKPGFHWSGKNSYAARRRAALDLITYISGLEKRKEPYHFVAHSHGGGVVWDALVLSELPQARERLGVPDSSEPTLKNLRSITTVGTPFLYWKVGLVGRILEYFAIFYLLGLPVAALIGWIALARSFGWIAREIYFVVSPQSGLPFSPVTEYVLSAIIVITITSALLYPLFSAWTANLLSQERYDAPKAANHYGGRCLFMYSDKDEAIQSLQAALTGSTPIMTKIGGRYESPFDTLAPPIHLLRTIAALALAPARWLHGRLIPPMGNRFIWSQLRRNAFGNDREGAMVASVDAVPFEITHPPNPLPKETTDSLLTISQNGVNAAMPEIRHALSEFAAGAIKKTGDIVSLDNTEHALLVHTSYFECDDIIDLINAHIYRHSHATGRRPSLEEHLYDYFEKTVQDRQRVAEALAAQIDNKIRKMDRINAIKIALYLLITGTGFIGIIFAIKLAQ